MKQIFLYDYPYSNCFRFSNPLFNEPLAKNQIPIDTKQIIFNDCFNQALLPNIIPRSVQSIIFGNKFNQILDKTNIPDSVIYISLGYDFCHSLAELPKSVKILRFNRLYYSVINNLPNTIRFITFDRINCPVSNLPILLEKITLNYVFLEELPNLRLPYNCIIEDLYGNKLEL
jgi:hypothetical protein